MSIDLLADMGFESEEEVIEKFAQLRAELAAKTAECERLKEHAHDLQSCYNAQCQCTDEWAEKYRNEVERKADATLLAAVEEAQKNQAIVNARLGVVQAERDKLLAERKELEAQEQKPTFYVWEWDNGSYNVMKCPISDDDAMYSAPFHGYKKLHVLFDKPPRPVHAVPEGWQLVPKEPTKAMREAGLDAYRNDGDEVNIWDSMLEVAPKEPT